MVRPQDVTFLVLIGADPERFWPVFTASPEHGDGQPDPMDRWSARLIGGLAEDLGAQALFPFGGPPWQPFQRWAARAEGARSSPIAMQVSPRRGLWMSYRGALGFRESRPSDPSAHRDPCLDCPAPCRTACPVDAFAGGSYDVPACVTYLRATPDSACHTGCRARMACPVGEAPPIGQRAFHMAAFLAAQGAGGSKADS